MRPIDADALKPDMKTFLSAYSEELTESYSQKAINNAPTIDAEPVRHGKWLDCDYKKLEHGFMETYPNAGKCCSNCRTGFKKEIVEGYIFCPNCGAKMEVLENEHPE